MGSHNRGTCPGHMSGPSFHHSDISDFVGVRKRHFDGAPTLCREIGVEGSFRAMVAWLASEPSRSGTSLPGPLFENRSAHLMHPSLGNGASDSPTAS